MTSLKRSLDERVAEVICELQLDNWKKDSKRLAKKIITIVRRYEKNRRAGKSGGKDKRGRMEG